METTKNSKHPKTRQGEERCDGLEFPCRATNSSEIRQKQSGLAIIHGGQNAPPGTRNAASHQTVCDCTCRLSDDGAAGRGAALWRDELCTGRRRSSCGIMCRGGRGCGTFVSLVAGCGPDTSGMDERESAVQRGAAVCASSARTKR